MANNAPEWFHDGRDGNAEMVINLHDNPDDGNSTVILVRGRNREEVAKRLAELLNRERFTAA